MRATRTRAALERRLTADEELEERPRLRQGDSTFETAEHLERRQKRLLSRCDTRLGPVVIEQRQRRDARIFVEHQRIDIDSLISDRGEVTEPDDDAVSFEELVDPGSPSSTNSSGRGVPRT